MDLSAKYRAKCPPKEHEEAVRMLLEGIGKQEAQIARQETSYRKASASSNNSFDYDTRSVRSMSSPSIVSSETNFNGFNQIKSSSTSDSNSTSSGVVDQDAMFREPIPSRTIAVQCDLKSSSTLRRLNGGASSIDGSMQASSISSTRYGFYNFTPETLELRRKMQRSVSNRDLTHRGHNDQIEAPTSMSELSFSENEALASKTRLKLLPEVAEAKRQLKTTSSSSQSSSSQSYHHLRQDVVRQRVPVTKITRSTLRDQPDQGSMSAADDSSTARAKINSLPRRPMTALSYVSASKLRHDHRSPSRDNRADGRGPMKSRAMSQQTLTRPRTPAPAELQVDTCSSSSDQDPDEAANGGGGGQETNPNRYHRRAPQVGTGTVPGQNRGSSEMSPVKPPRPTLVSSKHEEQVLDYRTLERRQQRSSTLQPADFAGGRGSEQSYKYGQRQTPIMGSMAHLRPQLDGRELHDGPAKFATIDRHHTHHNHLHHHHQDDQSYEEEYSSRLRDSQQRNQPLLEGSIEKENLASAHLREYHHAPHSKRDYSMSLSRRLKPIQHPSRHQVVTPAAGDDCYIGVQTNGDNSTSGYYTTNRVKPHKLSRIDRAHSQTHLPSRSHVSSPHTDLPASRRPMKQKPEVSRRSTSMRQIDRSGLAADRYDPNAYATPLSRNDRDTFETPTLTSVYPSDTKAFKTHRVGPRGEYVGRPAAADLYCTNQDQESDEDSESPTTRTWANPSVRQQQPPSSTINQYNGLTSNQTMNNTRKSSRSYSMRDVDNCPIDVNANNRYSDNDYLGKMRKNENISSYNSSSESSSLENAQRRFARQLPQLDHDSQHRLNEIGLPEVGLMSGQRRQENSASGSYLGISGGGYRDTTAGGGLYTSSRAPQITGRAMSQQSLTRPTMPLMSSRRRNGGSNSGSDVGGSSMSLVSRLHGRYENAHTRTPVVMYIPKAMPRASSHGDGGISLIGKSSTLRKSSRLRQKSSSQDRSRRSLSRNGSDSESSSMLRTLVRPRASRLQANYSSKRVSRLAPSQAYYDNEEEDIDGVGQLASEMDSYKFRRRYSVPKDAKINWFSKLKQRVSSAGK